MAETPSQRRAATTVEVFQCSCGTAALTTANIITDPNVKNDILRKIIVVTGTDGYQTVFSAGELDPEFGGHEVIVAYLQDGAPLDSTSVFARIITPNDKAGGRDVFTVASIRVIATR